MSRLTVDALAVDLGGHRVLQDVAIEVDEGPADGAAVA